jgi:hypothetical protein
MRGRARNTEADANGFPSRRLTVTVLAKALPYSWAEQDRRLGLDD